MQKIRKAEFPLAGHDTRFLPMTKSSPKGMLPIIDKPVVQYALEKTVEAGIGRLTGRDSQAIEDHFDTSYEFEDILRKKKQARHSGETPADRLAFRDFLYPAERSPGTRTHWNLLRTDRREQTVCSGTGRGSPTIPQRGPDTSSTWRNRMEPDGERRICLLIVLLSQSAQEWPFSSPGIIS